MKRIPIVLLLIVLPAALFCQIFGNWTITEKADPIDDSITLIALNSVTPTGGSTGDRVSLVIRNKDFINELYISWNDYLADNNEVTLRIDRNDPSTSIWLRSVDDTALFFPGNPNEFIKELRNAESLVARVFPYRAGAITAIFNIEGLSELISKYSESFALDGVVSMQLSDTRLIRQYGYTVELYWQEDENLALEFSLEKNRGVYFLNIDDLSGIERELEFLSIDTRNGRWLYRDDSDYPPEYFNTKDRQGKIIIRPHKQPSADSNQVYQTKLPNIFASELFHDGVVIQISFTDGSYYRISENEEFLELLKIFQDHIDGTRMSQQ